MLYQFLGIGLCLLGHVGGGEAMAGLPVGPFCIPPQVAGCVTLAQVAVDGAVSQTGRTQKLPGLKLPNEQRNYIHYMPIGIQGHMGKILS